MYNKLMTVLFPSFNLASVVNYAELTWGRNIGLVGGTKNVSIIRKTTH